MELFRILWRFRSTWWPHRYRLLLGIALVLLTSAIGLAAPWPLKIVVDDVLSDNGLSEPLRRVLSVVRLDSPMGALAALSIAVILLAALAALVEYASDRLLNGVGERMLAGLREKTFSHMQRLSLSFHNERRVGDLVNRITSDVNETQNLFIVVLSKLIPNVALLVGIVTVVMLIDPTFAFLTLVLMPVLFIVVWSFRKSIKAASREARFREGRVASHITETLGSIRFIQAYGAEDRTDEQFHDYSQDRLEAGLRRVDLSARLPAAVDIVAQVGTAAVLFIGGARVLGGQMSLGTLLVFISYLRQVLDPMRSLAKMTSTFSKGGASAERVEEVLRVEATITDRPNAIPAVGIRGDLELRNVTFGYEPGRPVLRDVNLRARPGETIALVGPTGSGKSTIAALLTRLYDPDAGEVLLDGRDIRDYTVTSLRDNVAVVLQESILLSGSIADNIAFGNPDASYARVRRAANAAFVDEFVLNMPDRFDSVVSERGGSLSGGQRQRIAIARALVKDAPVVVLDEPTSSLDVLSEQYVMRGLERLTSRGTVLVIAHRLSTLRKADRIYVLEKGRIVDSGTFEELSQRPGTFAMMNAAVTGKSVDQHVLERLEL